MENTIQKIFQKIKKTPYDIRLYEDCFECIKYLSAENKTKAYAYNGDLRKKCKVALRTVTDLSPLTVSRVDFLERINDVLKNSYHLEAYDIFDSYLIFLEWDRQPKKRFYLPRRKVLKVAVDDLQDLEDRKIKFYGLSLPPRVGKSTLCILFMTWHMGRYPETANVMSGYSDKLTDGFYREILSIINDKTNYLWEQVFPNVKLVGNSAKNETIDLDREKRFPTITCRSIEGTLTGAVEIGEDGVLYSDDLIEDLEESLNIERLQAKYDAYLNQLKDRKKDGALELMVGTRWNVLDPLGRIEEQYCDNPEYRFRVIPALNENDESNFDYLYGLGFSTEYYHDMRNSIDDATWWAKFMGQPYVREGLLFPQEELNYYNGIMPDGTPIRIAAAIDVAWGGGDSLSMPVAYLYDGGLCYIDDVVFNTGDKTVTQPLVVGVLKRNMPHQVQVEANNGGSEYCEKIDELLLKEGVRINMSHRKAPNTMSKLARIIQVAPEIKKFYFRDTKHSSSEYRAFMRELTSFVITGKNKHDDAPDSLAMLVNLLFSSFGSVEVIKRPC